MLALWVVRWLSPAPCTALDSENLARTSVHLCTLMTNGANAVGLEWNLPSPCIWLQGFLTGVLQTFARKYAIPIDTLNFGFEVRPEWTVDEIETGADDGVLVNGLFTDGARWNADKVRAAHLIAPHRPTHPATRLMGCCPHGRFHSHPIYG